MVSGWLQFQLPFWYISEEDGSHKLRVCSGYMRPGPCMNFGIIRNRSGRKLRSTGGVGGRM